MQPPVPDSSRPLLKKLFRASQIALFAVTCAWFTPAILPKFKITYETLGMTERPWFEDVLTSVFHWGFSVLPILALILLPLGFLTAPRASRQTLIVIMVLNWVVSILMPLWLFFGIRELRQM